MELASLILIHGTHKLLTIYIMFAICVEYEVSKALASLLVGLTMDKTIIALHTSME